MTPAARGKERSRRPAWQDARVRSLVVTAACALAVALSACSQKVLVKAPPGARVSLGDVEDEPVPEEGLRVQVGPGLSPVPFVVEDERGRREGALERSDVGWAWVAAGVTAAACCAPGLVVGAACLANPAFAPAALGCLVTQSPAPCCAALAAPSWATVIAAGGGALVGLSPLSLALLAEELPDEVTLESEAPAASSERAEREVPF